MEKIVNLLKKQITSTIIAILCGFIVVAILLTLTGYSPFEAFGILFNGIFSKPKYISQVIIKATPIILTGISVAFAFKVGLFNIGAEGQYIMGTIAATVAGILFDFPPVLQIPVVVLSGVCAGGIYGAIVGFLKAKYGIHEVITSIMLNWIAFYLGNFVVNTQRFHQPDSTGTYIINESGFTMFLYGWKRSEEGKAFLMEHPVLLDVILKTDVNFGIVFAIIVAVAVAILLKKTTKGYELRSVGFNKDAAEFAGIDVKKNILHAMLIAGAVAGLAGALTITGMSPHKISTMGTFENYGFNGMSVALIAGSSPIGCIFAGLLFAGLLYGGGSLQSAIGAPSEIINIMIGTIVFFVALTKIVPVLADKLVKRGEKHAR
ncbi:nucleoside ABC transporter membrane protein [Mobilisporobacter senegalensis]|uniref:Nucleoside ABC transporter membrane protein n=1 Tax=Mobilisporobacter senegalensis TaxID=1329262 RepID=A0A3N1XZ39_9FIRM|nr:ABC transporter permease [Mobilisporobacter senegalensis]ROR31876.1 nucleoside ABC transporter membrane protein [Mobilisporobacter senegalensis]